MPNATLRANARTLPEEETDAKADNADDRHEVDVAYYEWLLARAALEQAGDCSDVEGDRRLARRHAAEVALMAAPAAYPDGIWFKFELVESLVSEERIAGAAGYPLHLLALASLKADLISIGLRRD